MHRRRVLVERCHTRHDAPRCSKGSDDTLWAVREKIRVSLADHMILILTIRHGVLSWGDTTTVQTTVAESQSHAATDFVPDHLRPWSEAGHSPSAAGQCDPALELRGRLARRGDSLALGCCTIRVSHRAQTRTLCPKGLALAIVAPICFLFSRPGEQGMHRLTVGSRQTASPPARPENVCTCAHPATLGFDCC